MKLSLYNTLSKKIEEFNPLNPPNVTMYSCGLTVYYYAHIGNFRTYVSTDILRRTLEYLGYNITQVMNVTDVGHMTSDEDEGEDKIEKRAEIEKKSPWEIAKFYEDYFFNALNKLNIYPPTIKSRGTEHIHDMIKLISKLENLGYVYKTNVGAIFNTSKFANYPNFARLNLEGQKSGHRVKVDEERKNPWDFALWVTNQKNHIMQWDSPWGKGFPGWHIECSAMSMKYLGEQIDIHSGGIDHITVHHTNEIAQSEAATGKKFVNYWFHCNFLTVDNQKMSKSLGNLYTLEDLANKGIIPLSLRFFYLYSTYQKALNFTWEALISAQNSLIKLWSAVKELPLVFDKPVESVIVKFENAMCDNLNTPNALALLWEILNSDYSSEEKASTIFEMDRILGLDLKNANNNLEEFNKFLIHDPLKKEKAMKLAEKRDDLRGQKKYKEADEIRGLVHELGFIIKDTVGGFELIPLQPKEKD